MEFEIEMFLILKQFEDWRYECYFGKEGIYNNMGRLSITYYKLIVHSNVYTEQWECSQMMS